MLRAPPGADGLTFDEEGARPDTGRPQRPAWALVGHQEFTVGALQQEPGIAARQEPCRSRWGGRRAEQRLILAQYPRFTDARAHRRQRPAERFECSDTARGAYPRPPRACFGPSGAE